MARLPGWMADQGIKYVDGQAVWHFRVRRWHPGYWLARWRMWRVWKQQYSGMHDACKIIEPRMPDHTESRGLL